MRSMEPPPTAAGRPSPLDALVPHLPPWLRPHFQALQPHVDAVMRLLVAALDDVARQLAPYLHQAVDAASPHVQVSGGAQHVACST